MVIMPNEESEWVDQRVRYIHWSALLVQRDNSDFEAKKKRDWIFKMPLADWKVNQPIWQKGLLVQKIFKLQYTVAWFFHQLSELDTSACSRHALLPRAEKPLISEEFHLSVNNLQIAESKIWLKFVYAFWVVQITKKTMTGGFNVKERKF